MVLALAGVLASGCAGISNRLANPSHQGTTAVAAARVDDPPPGRSSTVGVAERFERPITAVPRPTWQTLSTPHFVVHTDAFSAQSGALLAHLERIRQSLAQWFDADPVAMEIILFASATDYRRRFGGTVALDVDMSPGREVFVTHLEQMNPSLDEVVDQALVVRFVRAKFGALPEWLADGLVTHFGAARLHQDRLLLGGPPSILGLDKEVGDIAPIKDLFAADAPDVEPLARRTLRTSAWALVGYLLDESVWGGNAAARLQAWLALAGRSGGSARAISDAFTDIYPERSLADVDFAFRAHARSAAGTHRYQHFIAAPQVGDPVVKAVPLTSEHVEGVLNKAREDLALPRAVDPRKTEALLLWRENKPRHQMRLAVDWSEPGSAYGLAYGYSFLRDHSLDVELGKTGLGHFMAARYRADFEVENARNLFLNLAFGPQLALKNQFLGLTESAGIGDATDPGTSSFYHLGLSAEVAAGVFLWRGLHLRVSGAWLFKLATNFDDFCPDPRFHHDLSCPEIAQLARDAVIGLIRLGAGYAW